MEFIAKNFEIRPGRIDFVCIPEEGKELNIYYELSKDVVPSNDLIACSCATFCGTKYQKITIDLPVEEKTVDLIHKFTQAEVVVSDVIPNHNIKKGKNIILNFSGGFDSLAAKILMPENTKLVAIDFGGWFKREAVFFEKFDPYILKTNFRELRLDRNSWTFMGVAAILYSDYLQAGYNVFGTILEASKAQFCPNPVAAYSHTNPFVEIGLKDIRYTNGLTEVGTIMVVSHYAPELAAESLKSLSNPKTEKRYRKEVLLNIVCEKFGRTIDYEPTEAPDKKIPFGENLALDFLGLYIIKNKGISTANETLSNIPSKAIELATSLELSFYERLNCEYLNGSTFPSSEEKGRFMQKVLNAGIVPYSENDYAEYRKIADFLNEYHDIYPNNSKVKKKWWSRKRP